MYQVDSVSPHLKKLKKLKINGKFIFASGKTGIAQSVQRRVTGWTARFRFPAGVTNFLFPTEYRPTLGPIQPHTLRVPGTLSPKVKRPELQWPALKRLGREADNAPSPSADVKNGEAIPTLPLIYSWPRA
jgi:hypothetical protein